MDDNNEQEAAANVINAINDDNDGVLFERIYLGQTLDNIPDIPFRLLVHSSVTEIHDFACDGCVMLRDVVFQHNVITIGQYSFDYCRNLEHIQLPEGLLRLEGSAFHNCTSLQQIVIPASVQFIGDCVFDGCTSLERVVFAPTMTIELGEFIFHRCTNLRFVTLPQNLQSIPAGFFYRCTSLTRLQLPESVEQIEEGAFEDSSIQAIAILENDENIPDTVILPPKLQIISRNCFKNCKSLTHIRIPPSVRRIRKYAFKGSGLLSIEIPKNVHLIGVGACRNCSSLERVTFHSSNNLTLGSNIFANCPSLSIILMYPWLWPKLFASMNRHPDFILKFFRQYQTQIFDFETLRRLRRDRRR